MKKYILGLLISMSFVAFGVNADITSSACDAVLTLSDYENILIRFETNLEDADENTQASFFFVQQGNEYHIMTNTLLWFSNHVKNMLEQALVNKIHLDESIKYEIGYSLNEILEYSPDLLNKESNKVWLGSQYMLLSGRFVAWIYNYNDTIVFRLTTVYRGKNSSGSESDKAITYEQWIRKYRPLVRELSKDTVREWIATLSCILKTLEKNIKRTEAGEAWANVK